MTIQRYEWCHHCKIEWSRDDGDDCPECGGYGKW